MLVENSDLSIGLTVDLDLTEATLVEVNFESPITTGTIEPTIRDAAAGSLIVDLTPELNSSAGTWKLWVTVEMGGKVYKSSAVQFPVEAEGTVE